MGIQKNIFILSVLLLFSSLCFSQEKGVQFEAKVSKEKLGVNERLRIDFTMNKDGDNFTPPDFNGFTVVMGPNQSVSHSWINGKRSFSKTYSYVLAPVGRGKFSIKQATIEIDGNIYKTLPVTVEVTAAVANSDNNAEQGSYEADLHLVAEVSNSSPYLNEAITVVYKLYVSPDTNVSDFRPLDNPTYNNFWNQDIEIKRLEVKNGTYKGKPYRYVILKQVVLYPQKEGKLTLEPLSLDVTVDVPTNRRDFFGSRLYTQTHKTVSAGNRTINVKSLPQKGKPADFTGAVGKFNFKVTSSKKDLKASESLQLKVEVQGKGNFKLFSLPKIDLPSSMEVYNPEFKENISTSLSGMSGSVSDNYTVVPQFKGQYPIPSTSFSYFDPSTGSYKTIHSEQAVIDVLEGPQPTASSTAAPGNTKQSVVATGSQFKFIKLSPSLRSMEKEDFFGSGMFYTLLLAPFLLIPLAVFAIKKKQEVSADVQGNRIRKANRLAKKYLSEARKALGKKEEFYVALERALHNYLKAKIHIETSEFSKEKITSILEEKEVDGQNVEGFIGLLQSCELARYTPASEVAMQQDYEKAVSVISRIDKQI
ncbi:BatD family protein [Sinomicrobium weinanense]|uniref:Protein BatD n=1 Tax=Sinomicrobium weinanense TaxID=2842200 RepID=A0A926Q260_9FLAO|nr:BatD family protein [Sinomicrobium weinanense]MBC9794350.1 protein BatD [Sinomicrobium weinanense]MBU3124257.1 BatD family protein [Sinomicrobium weinanense]